MASKKDLVEAQTFSRRRLLTAFVSGAPGGRELEPGKPLRAVVGGVTLTVLLALGSIGFGLLRPTLPQGWDHNALVTTDGGSRYLALDGVLYPVLNTTSARLLVPSDRFAVHAVGDDRITDAPRGSTIGIPGAPDALPSPDRLVASSWLVCTATGQGEAVVLADDARVAATTARALEAALLAERPGLLVETAGDLHLVTDGRRHLVPRQERDAVLRAIGQESVVPWAVSARWLNLFPEGSPLTPPRVDGAGDEIPRSVGAPPGTVVGSVLVATDIDRRYVVEADGELAVLSEFAAPLYRAGATSTIGEPVEVTSAQIAGLRTADEPVAPADWPEQRPTGLDEAPAACALLVTTPDGGAEVHVVATEEVHVPEQGTEVRVAPAAGAVVQAAGGAGEIAPVHVIDQTGTAFAVPGADDELLARLGYAPEHVVRVPPAWMALFPTGPDLTVEGAQQTVQPGSTGEGA